MRRLHLSGALDGDDDRFPASDTTNRVLHVGRLVLVASGGIASSGLRNLFCSPSSHFHRCWLDGSVGYGEAGAVVVFRMIFGHEG